jgi:SAM-dependent methyltransferase
MAHVAVERVRTLLEACDWERPGLLRALLDGGVTLPARLAEAQIGAAVIDDLIASGLAGWRDDGLVASVRVVQFRGALLAFDRGEYRQHADFVLGPGPSSDLLADAVRPIAAGRVLDLGCGPGTQALWLARHGGVALGVDISERALAFASFNRDLNRAAAVTFEVGDFLTKPPDRRFDEAFDVVVANPPFVLAPASSLVYRDRPLPGHATTRVAVERVMRALAPGGRGYVLGTWFDDGRGAWDATPREWLRDSGCRAVVSRVSSHAPAAYAQHWTRDLPIALRAAAAGEWAASLEADGARRITTGLVALAKTSMVRWKGRFAITAVDRARPGWRAIEAMLAGR